MSILDKYEKKYFNDLPDVSKGERLTDCKHLFKIADAYIKRKGKASVLCLRMDSMLSGQTVYINNIFLKNEETDEEYKSFRTLLDILKVTGCKGETENGIATEYGRDTQVKRIVDLIDQHIGAVIRKRKVYPKTAINGYSKLPTTDYNDKETVWIPDYGSDLRTEFTIGIVFNHSTEQTAIEVHNEKPAEFLDSYLSKLTNIPDEEVLDNKKLDNQVMLMLQKKVKKIDNDRWCSFCDYEDSPEQTEDENVNLLGDGLPF